MKVSVYDSKGKKSGKFSLGHSFSQRIRPDLVQRAFVAERSQLRQPYGADKMAGKRSSAHYHGRRDERYTMMNREMARMKRIHNQGYLDYTARVVPQARKGRKAHPPKPEKKFTKKINRKERKKALQSAVSASAKKELVEERGHRVSNLDSLPIVVSNEVEKMDKTQDVLNLLHSLGLKEELERTKNKKKRAGKGKKRGRKYRTKRGPMFIVTEDSQLKQAAANIPGVDVSTVKELNFTLLSPGGQPGRLCIWSKKAAEEVDEMVS